MQEIKNFVHKSLFIFGERLAFLLVIIAFGIVISLESAGPVFSQGEEVYSGFTENGLTYEFHLSTSYSYSADSEVSVLVNSYSEEEEVEYVEVKELEQVENETVDSSSDYDNVWERLAQCESGGDWSINTGNGYYGGLQFSEGAWNSVGGTGLPHEHSREEQIEKGKALQEMRGWGAWGLCAQKLELN